MFSKKQQKEKERQLIEAVNSRGNDNKCGECGASHPTWASYTLGILLCGRCASVHKRVLGPPNHNISKVKSLTLDNWTEEQINQLRRIGNKKAKRKWNSKRIPFPYDGDDDVSAVEQYLRDKYIAGKFRDDGIDNSEYDDRSSKFSDADQGSSYSQRALTRLRSNSARSQSASIPRLTHRKLTTFEYTQYYTQAMKIRLYGYNDRDAVLESLLLSNGNIELALDILEQDSKINPTKEEIAPELPRRPQPSSANTNEKTQVSSDEWWNGNTTALPQVPAITGAQTTGMPQIYQYTDPVTGQISYIDSNGQEYLDPNNPQHQNQLMQISNPQLIAQQTNKQNILSLYNQPTGQAFTQQQQPQQQQQQQPQYTNTVYLQQQQQQQPQQPQQQPQFTGFGQTQQTGYMFGQYPQQQNGYWRQ